MWVETLNRSLCEGLYYPSTRAGQYRDSFRCHRTRLQQKRMTLRKYLLRTLTLIPRGLYPFDACKP